MQIFETYLKCNYCDNHFTRLNLLSGNTFGAKLYSDCYRYAPMLPAPIELELCTECHRFNWLRDLTEIENLSPEAKVQDAIRMDISTTIKAIDESCYTELGQEVYLRTQLWWAFNDRVREGKPLFEHTNEEQIWADNLFKFLELLKREIIDHLIMEIEIQRNFGNFEEALRLLATVSKDYKSIADQFEHHILMKYKLVFKLEP